MESDLIYRQDAIDVINNHFGFNIGEEYGSAVQEVINALPSAQPEIIRCKDCKHYKTEFCAIDIWTDEVKIYKAKPDDFCSRAERRQDETN